MVKNILFYRTLENKCPVEDFLESLSDKEARKVTWVLKLLKDLEKIPTNYLKKMINTDNIWEVRIQMGNNIFRLLGFFEGDDLIILTNGFQKKTQKTPINEISLTEERKKEYTLRSKKNG